MQEKAEHLVKKEWNEKDFINRQFISKGKYGIVYKCREIYSNKYVALKIIKKELIIKYNMVKQLRRELEIQSHLKHKYIVELYGYFTDQNNIYVVMEYVSGGTLYDLFEKKSNFNENEISSIILKIANAVDYLQKREIIHRDLKLENILIDENKNIKLADFGWAVHSKREPLRDTICGTIQYLAPEILSNEPYNKSIDIWCLGIITYELLFGNSPFELNSKENRNAIFNKIKNLEYKLDHDEKPISNDAKDFIQKILEKNPENRMKIEEIYKHPFILIN